MRNISAGIGGQVGHLMVNGPASDALCWGAIDWRCHEDNVRRLRQRIFTAARDGDLGKLRNLQKLMLRSWSNTLLSVRQATQRNARGRGLVRRRMATSWRSTRSSTSLA